MNTNERPWVSRLLLAAGIAIALPALAGDGDEVPNMGNSEAFRQGYKAGFDDGFSRGYQRALDERRPAAQPAPPPPPRATGPITVSRAVYGSGSRLCDATRWVASRANGRRSANLDASNNICGDPAPGDRKSLEVTYVCGSVAKTASANEHRGLTLDCTP
jgi:hypothetical protein